MLSVNLNLMSIHFSKKLPGVPETLLKRRKTLEKIKAARAAAKLKTRKVSNFDHNIFGVLLCQDLECIELTNRDFISGWRIANFWM